MMINLRIGDVVRTYDGDRYIGQAELLRGWFENGRMVKDGQYRSKWVVRYIGQRDEQTAWVDERTAHELPFNLTQEKKARLFDCLVEMILAEGELKAWTNQQSNKLVIKLNDDYFDGTTTGLHRMLECLDEHYGE